MLFPLIAYAMFAFFKRGKHSINPSVNAGHYRPPQSSSPKTIAQADNYRVSKWLNDQPSPSSQLKDPLTAPGKIHFDDPIADIHALQRSSSDPGPYPPPLDMSMSGSPTGSRASDVSMDSPFHQGQQIDTWTQPSNSPTGSAKSAGSQSNNWLDTNSQSSQWSLSDHGSDSSFHSATSGQSWLSDGASPKADVPTRAPFSFKDRTPMEPSTVASEKTAVAKKSAMEPIREESSIQDEFSSQLLPVRTPQRTAASKSDVPEIQPASPESSADTTPMSAAAGHNPVPQDPLPSTPKSSTPLGRQSGLQLRGQKKALEKLDIKVDRLENGQLHLSMSPSPNEIKTLQNNGFRISEGNIVTRDWSKEHLLGATAGIAGATAVGVGIAKASDE